MDMTERLNRVEEVICEMQDLSKSGVIIIVEGKNDVIALRALGVIGPIEIATRRPLFLFAEDISKKTVKGNEVIILTDWDRRGGFLASRISEYLRSMDTIPNNRLRSKLSSLVRKEVTDVESLSGYVEKLRYTVLLGCNFNVNKTLSKSI